MKRSWVGACLSVGVMVLCSVFMVVATIGFRDTADELVSWQGEETVIAYDGGEARDIAMEDELGYVRPLGESVTVRANKGRVLETLAVAQMTALVGVGVVAVVAAFVGLRCWKNSQKK